MGKLGSQPIVTDLTGSEFMFVVVTPNSGSTDPHRISVADTLASAAFTAAFPTAASLIDLDDRVAFLEAGGVWLQDSALATPIVSNTAFTDIANSSSIPAATFDAGDMLTCEFVGDLLINNAANSVVEFQWLVAALTISTTPAAGWSIAFGANRRPIHAWMAAVFSDATHFHWASGIEVASPKAAATEMGPFNGNTTGRDSVASFTGTGVNIASAMTFKLQGKHSVSGAATDMRRLRQTWSIVKA